MRRHAVVVVLSSVALLLAAPAAFAQETPPPPDGEGGVQQSTFNLSDFETGLLNSQQLVRMQQISQTRQNMISQLEKLLRDRPLYPNKAEIFFRLGEAYWEESKYQYLLARQKYDAEFDAFENGNLAVKPTEPKENFSTALAWYRKVIQQFPDYSRIDEVMYYLGRGALQQGKENQDRNLVKEGVTYFQKLVQNYPRSRFIPQAHLQLGEHFFETDSLYYAKTNYEKIINNYTNAPMYNYALYKLGWVYFNLREFRKTIDTFQKVVENLGEGEGQVSFRDQALNDLLKPWAEMDDSWREALGYFKTVIEDEEDIYKRMEQLASLYVGFDKDKEALELYNHFVERTPTNAKVVNWLGAIIEVRRKINDFTQTESEIRRMIAYFTPEGSWMTTNRANTEVVDEANNLAESNLLQLSNHFHREAEKAERGSKPALATEMYAKAASDYKLFLQRFPNSSKAYLIRFYYAEILYGQLNDYAGALESYQLVIDADSKGEYIEDAALGVIYSSYELMVKEGLREAGSQGRIVAVRLNESEAEAQREDEDQIQQTPLHTLEQSYVKAADQYVNLLLKLREDEAWARANPKRGERIPEIMFMAADTFYNHGHFKEAVDRLKLIFRYDPNHKYAAVAAVTMIKAYYRLRRWERVEEWARKLIQQRNFRFKTKDELEEYIAIAIHENSMDLSRARRHDEAIAESMRLVREFRRRKGFASRALMNVAVLYERARRTRDAVRTYERVIREYKGEEVAPEAQFTIGLIYEAQTRFREASAAFLKMERFKDHPKAPDAILNSGLIREAMKDYTGAIKSFQKFLTLWPRSDEAASAFFKIGLLLERIGDKRSLTKAVRHYISFTRKYPDRYVMKVEAFSRAGDILRRLDLMATNAPRNLNREGQPKRIILRNRRKATGHFESAIAEYNKAVQQIATLSGEERIGKTVTANRYAAQARYWIADYIFQDFDAVKIPGTMRISVLRKALIEKAELHQAAERAFDTVLGFKDAGWIACAAFRNGLLYYNFAEELFAVPIPFGLSPEQEDAYRAALEEIGAPVQEKALILLQAALRAAHDKGVYNRCAKQAGLYAAKVNPEGFPISGDDQLQPNRTKDTLLSANFIRILRRGNVVVDMMVRTSADTPTDGSGSGD